MFLSESFCKTAWMPTDSKYKDNKEGTITITLEEGKSIVFTDNGVGLTESEIHRFLSIIGESSKRDIETGRILNEYIGRFLQLSSNLIKRSEEHNKALNRLARDRKLEDLYAELKSQQFINGGIRMFHQNFDEAFLNIYPDFIVEVNKLMSEDNQFMPSEDGHKKLTTELRILALIRLGISDNQEIADILRSSITTIYTYRSKLKAKAINKGDFEDDIRQISTY